MSHVSHRALHKYMLGRESNSWLSSTWRPSLQPFAFINCAVCEWHSDSLLQICNLRMWIVKTKEGHLCSYDLGKNVGSTGSHDH